MKLYYTLAQSYQDDYSFRNHLDSLNIKYHMSTDFRKDLVRASFSNASAFVRSIHASDDDFIRTFVILADESDMTAIRLAYPEVSIVKNRDGLEFKNKFRRLFDWKK